MNPQYLLQPRPEQYLPLFDGLRHLKRVSAAPELPGGLELGRALRGRGVVASVAHTDATFQQIVAAVEAGYTHATHLYSAMSSIRRQDGYRLTGAIESVLVLDELTAELIADGHHLPPSLLKLAIKAKGVNSICAITDSMAAAGLGPGSYTLGGLEVIVEDAIPAGFEVPGEPGCLVAKLPDRSCFAGSVATMDQVVRNMVRLGGLSLADAIRTATVNPARVHGITGRGVLAAGMKADITVLDATVAPTMTIVEGEVVFRRVAG
jgi:N-acetylglucosamine-6-phosphate deacetylase